MQINRIYTPCPAPNAFLMGQPSWTNPPMDQPSYEPTLLYANHLMGQSSYGSTILWVNYLMDLHLLKTNLTKCFLASEFLSQYYASVLKYV